MRNSWIKVIFIFSLLLSIIGFGLYPLGNVARADVKEDTTTAKVPKAVFPETQYNFKSVTEGTEITHDFIIENRGQAPLVIDRVQPD